MRSRPSKRSPRAAAGRLLGPAFALLLVGCAGAVAPETPVQTAERPFLVSPLAGLPLSLEPDRARLVESLHRQLVAGESPANVRSRLAPLLAEDPPPAPALVVAAQVDYLERRFDAALERLEPVIAELPDYGAARLLEGRVAEALGELPRAYAAYRSVAGAFQPAALRASELLPRATEILETRVDEALDRGRTGEAAADLERLREWAPESPGTWRSEARVARARGDRPGELEALRRLAPRAAEERQLAERRAELEVEVGEVGAGLEILERLVGEYPDDGELLESLARARFSWRLRLLPPAVRGVVERPELDRADLAALLFWLFPDVRFGRAEGATIANDVFQHPFRDEIVRVVNLGLLSVDRTLHRFEPDRPVTRGETAGALLGLLARKRPPLACLGSGSPTASRRCELAARCGLIAGPDECLPGASLSGREASQMARRAVELLGLE